MRRYESPDDQSTWSILWNAAMTILWMVLGVIFALRGDTALTVLAVGMLLLNELEDIRDEVRASRRLTEQSTRRAVRYLS